MASASLDVESTAVQTHLTIMQDVIRRMAENSRSCKVWCVTLVAAVLVLAAQNGNADHALIALVPALLFLVLDTYYLALERGFRNSYDAFVRKLHSGELTSCDLYVVKPTEAIPKLFLQCLPSFSIWPFYLMVAGMAVILARWLIAP